MTAYLISGLPKTGTSALYATLKRALPGALTIYEPARPAQFDYIRASEVDNKVIKILHSNLEDHTVDLSFFDHKIMITRDPRDSLISFILYYALLGDRPFDFAMIDRFIDLLKRKEAHPRSVPLLDLGRALTTDGSLCDLFSPARHQKASRLTAYMLRRYKDFHVITYDTFKAGDLAGLEASIGLAIPRKTKVSDHLSFNERSKTSGGWRDWFTPDDIVHLRPMMQDYMTTYGFGDNWDLPEIQTLDPAHGSAYVERNVAQVRAFPNRFGEFRGREVFTDDYLRHLNSAAEDGAEGAFVELGVAALVRDRDVAAYRRWITAAAERGNPLGLLHLGMAFERGIGGPVDHDRARAYFHQAATARGNAKTKSSIKRWRDVFDEIWPLTQA